MPPSPQAPASDKSPFAQAVERLSHTGLILIPIIPPDCGAKGAGKAPGHRMQGRWVGLRDWTRYLHTPPSPFEIRAWSAAPDCGVGALLGQPIGDHILAALDVDITDEDVLRDVLSACPPAVMAKRGAKGLTIFVRAPASMPSRSYRDADGVVILDVLSTGRQTVIPESRHVSGVPYQWTAGPVPLATLPIYGPEEQAQLEEALEVFAGWSREGERLQPPKARDYDADGSDDWWRETNEAALANLSAWFPALDGLRRATPTFDGWKAVPAYRPSGTGRDIDERGQNLSATSAGIRDWGSGEGHTAIDLVRLSQRVDGYDAATWLRQRLGLVDESPLSPDFFDNMQARKTMLEAAARAPSITMPEPAGRDAPPPQGAGTPVGLIDAPAFVWQDPRTLPRRPWVYGRHLIRGYVSLTIAPGGVGKSSLTITEALAMVTGRPLLDIKVKRPLRVWLFNGEDPLEELRARVTGAMLHFGITQEDIGDRLRISSGREMELIVAQDDGKGLTINEPVWTRLEQVMLERQIDVLVLDPFVSIHMVPENDNTKIDRVVKRLGRLAGATNAAIELVHHSRKLGGADTTVEDSRGASAVLAGVRSARTLNRMSREEAGKLGIQDDEAVRLFRVDTGKANLAPLSARPTWRQLVSVSLGNEDNGEPADWVGVVEPYEPPKAMDGITVDDLLRVQQAIERNGNCRESDRSPDWVGATVAHTLGLDAKRDKGRIATMLRNWLDTGALAIDRRKDESRQLRNFVVVGEYVNPTVQQFA